MKKIIIIIFILILVTGLSAQEEDQMHFAIANTKMNTLYVGIDNPLNIAVSNVNPEDIEIKASHGEIRKIDMGYNNSNYLIRIMKYEDVELRIYEKGILLGTRTFRTLKLPKAKAGIGFIKRGNITKEMLLTHGAVTTSLQNFVFDVNPEVTEQTLCIYVNDFRISIRSDNPKFSDKQIEAINHLKSGDRISFNNIRAIMPDGSKDELNTIEFIIK